MASKKNSVRPVVVLLVCLSVAIVMFVGSMFLASFAIQQQRPDTLVGQHLSSAAP